MKYKLVIGTALGALIGGGLGYLVQCSGGMCQIMATPWRGMAVGAVIGLLSATLSRLKNKD